MGLKSIRKRLAIDQRNLLRAVVLSTSEETVTVRMQDGAVRSCRLASGQAFVAGNQVQVATDGTSYTVAGSSPLKELAAELVVEI